MSGSLSLPHGLQHIRLPCPSLTSGACSNSCYLSCWCHPTNKSVLLIRWPKYCSFSISPSNEHSGLLSFRIDWFDLHAVQGTLKNLLQHHNSKASILRCSAFFMVQLTSIHDYWKNQHILKSFKYKLGRFLMLLVLRWKKGAEKRHHRTYIVGYQNIDTQFCFIVE